VGEYSYVGKNTDVLSGVSIGRYCSIASNVTIGAPQHRLDAFTTFELWSALEIPGTVIEHDVWIGCNAVIMAGVTICTGAVVGAGAIVTKNVPPYAIVVGNPAHIMRYRFDEGKIARLLASKWWERDRSEVTALTRDFNGGVP